jgi:RNA polymerase sigma-70 factor (ECF subfamily)
VPPADDSSAGSQPAVESTAVLFDRIRQGDEAARQRLFERFLPILQRWAHGRLPGSARGLADTDDLVQITLIRALNRLTEFEPRREGAFLSYLRQILLNSVREELRRATRKPSAASVEENLPDPSPSVIEQAVGSETLARYESALAALPEEHREAVILRIEFDYSYPEIAEALGRPSANAARMSVTRALVKLAEAMDDESAGA